MNYKPLVTIVIPVYNGSTYLGEAIESALQQTYSNIEIIVINDGSRDEEKTSEVAKKYINEIKYIEKNNGGVSSVLNQAFRMMNGEWLSWLSHDDKYYPEKIEKQIYYINKNKISDLNRTVIFSDFDFIDEYGGKLNIPTKNKMKSNMNTEELILYNIKRNSFGGCTFLIPKNAYNDIGGFSEDLRTISDFDYWYRLLFNGYKFYYIPEKLVSNRMHSEQVTYTLSDRAEVERVIFHKQVLKQLKENQEYCSESNFLKVAFYMGCKGIDEVAKIAYKYAVEQKTGKFIKIKILGISFVAKTLHLIRSILRYLYIKHFIFNKTKKMIKRT